MNRKEILNKAEEIINGDREGTYGKPEDSFDRIAQLWSVYLNHDISSVDVANMMVLLKVARNAGGVYKDDNWIDICGYAALGGEIQSKFDYDSFEQYMNKPVEEQKKFDDWGPTHYNGVKYNSGRYPWGICVAGDPKGSAENPKARQRENFMDVKDMKFDSLSDAIITSLRIRNLVKEHGSCTVSDYYGICGGPSAKYMDTKYGWDDPDIIVSELSIEPSKFGKWALKMPPAVRLDKGENE